MIGLEISEKTVPIGPWHAVRNVIGPGDPPHRMAYPPSWASASLAMIWADPNDHAGSAVAVVDPCGCWARVLEPQS